MMAVWSTLECLSNPAWCMVRPYFEREIAQVTADEAEARLRVQAANSQVELIQATVDEEVSSIQRKDMENQQEIFIQSMKLPLFALGIVAVGGVGFILWKKYGR